MKADENNLRPESLKNSLYMFEVCSRQAVETLLGVPTRVMRVFAISDTLSNPFAFACLIRSRNQSVAATVWLGFEKDELEKLLPYPSGLEDIIGETVNTIAGNCLSNPLFSTPYGRIETALPLFHRGMTSPQKISCCIQGLLRAGSVPIFLAFGVDLQG